MQDELRATIEGRQRNAPEPPRRSAAGSLGVMPAARGAVAKNKARAAVALAAMTEAAVGALTAATETVSILFRRWPPLIGGKE